MTLHPLTFLLVGLCVLGSTVLPAWAEPLQGTYTDALTGTPIQGVEVRVRGSALSAVTDAQGRWSFELAPGQYEVEFSADVDGQTQRSSLVNQHVPQYKPAHAKFYGTALIDQGVPMLPGAPGLPAGSGQLPAEMPEFLELEPRALDPLALSVPVPIPRRIRVARRAAPEKSCRDNPIVAIEEMDLDEYVKGVLPPEIGVFRSIPGASEVYKEFAIAAKSYGLWFMLYYTGERQRTSDPKPPLNYDWFHIDDTACNQRYGDDRMSITTEAARAVENKIMVKKGAPEILDKIEYAASCGRHGTLPEYGSPSLLIPDLPPQNACAGSWCGHDKCAGHEDNTALPGADRCLVRGICQWGSASWGKSGKDYLWMLDHYQPNLQIRDLSDAEPPGPWVTLVGYAHTDASAPAASGLSGAQISLSDGQSTLADSQGLFTFAQVPLSLGTAVVTANAPGYARGTTNTVLMAGEPNRADVLLLRQEASPLDMGTPPPLTDMGRVQPRDFGLQSPGGLANPGPLGSLLTVSPGIEGGCGGCTSSSGSRDSSFLASLALLGLGLCVRRRRGRKA